MAQGPPVPSYIFRGHASPVHALHFYDRNSFLASGDSDGWIIIWSLATKRPVAVWRGHDGGIMALNDWGSCRLISHGRDHRLRVWQLLPTDYDHMDITLPVDGAKAESAKQPWLLHSLSINALNYCAFSICEVEDNWDPRSTEDQCSRPSLFLAAANGLDSGGIDIFHLPSEHRVCKLASNKETQTGMVMAVAIFKHPSSNALTLASGYESGHVLMHVQKETPGSDWTWTKALTNQAHSQPILSLDVSSTGDHFFTSSADAVVAKFDVKSETMVKKADTKHAGQQDLKVRDDSKIFATSGWDKRVRVYSTKTLKELAVLKWHKEGCYATAFADTVIADESPASTQEEGALIKRAVEILKSERLVKTQQTHWLAAGGKDGKISLWDIY